MVSFQEVNINSSINGELSQNPSVRNTYIPLSVTDAKQIEEEKKKEKNPATDTSHLRARREDLVTILKG